MRRRSLMVPASASTATLISGSANFACSSITMISVPNTISKPPPQVDGAGVREHGYVDCGHGALGGLLLHDDIRSRHDVGARVGGDAGDRGDGGLVGVTRVVQAAGAARAPVLVGLLAAGERF